MEELKCALLGYFGDRIGPDGLSPEAASSCDPAQVTFINETISTVAQHIPLIRAYCEANDLGRLEGFVARSFALACRDLLEAYENAVLENLNLDDDHQHQNSSISSNNYIKNNNNNCCSLIELKTAFAAVLSRCSDFIRKSTPRDKLASLILSVDDQEYIDEDNIETDEDDDDGEDIDEVDDRHRDSSMVSRRSNSQYQNTYTILKKLSSSPTSTTMTVSEKTRRIFQILSEPLLPSPIRASMGIKFHKTLIVNIAHWVCYGNIIEDHHQRHANHSQNKKFSTQNHHIRTFSDFFVVQLESKQKNHQIQQHRTTQGDLALDEWKIPHGFSMSLCTTILVAGRERKQLDIILKNEEKKKKTPSSNTTSSNNNRNGGSLFENKVLSKNRQNVVNHQTNNSSITPSNNNHELRSLVKDENNRRERENDVVDDTNDNEDKRNNTSSSIMRKRSQSPTNNTNTSLPSSARRRNATNNNNNNNLLLTQHPDVALSSAIDEDDERAQESERLQREQTPRWAYNLLMMTQQESNNNNNNNNNFLISQKTGELAVDELDRRITVIRNSWANQLWNHVERQGALRKELHAAREMFLCNRGDLWHTFVERSSPAILGWTYHQQHQSSDAALEVAQQRMMISNSNTSSPAIMRWVLEAFKNSMGDVRLSESERHLRFEFTYNNNNNNSSQSQSQQNPNNTTTAGGGGIMNFDEAGRSMFSSIRLIGLKWKLPTALTHVIKQSSLVLYERLFVSNLALKFSVFCLNQCKRFASETQSMSSRAGRQFVHCVQLLHFFLSNVAYSWQVDVQDTHFRTMFEQLDKATSVEEAHRAHAVFVDNLTAGAFLADEGRDVARCVGELVVLAFSLFALAREDSTRKNLDAIAVAEKKGVALNPRGQELSNNLERVVLTVVKKVTQVMSPIASSRRAEHRALWTRLDFNGWFSQQAEKLRTSAATTNNHHTGQQHQQQQPSVDRAQFQQQQQNRQRF